MQVVGPQGVPADGGVEVAELEDVAVVERGTRTCAGADAIEVGPPEVIAHSASRREAEGVAIREREADVATHGGRAGDGETWVCGVDVADHGLCGGGAVEEVAPGKGRVGLGVVDDEDGAVAARAYPVKNVGEGNGGVDGVGGYHGCVGRCSGIGCGEGNGEIVDAAVAVARTGHAAGAAGNVPQEGQTGTSGHGGVLAESDGVVMEHTVVSGQGVDADKGRGVG